MASAGTMKLCVLWEDELRKAAKLLAIAEDMYRAEGDTEGFAKAAAMAYSACRIALTGLEDDSTIAMCAKPDVRQEA